MQDKETVDEAEESIISKTEVNSAPDKKENETESSKDGKFAFKKMKQPKKEKADKNKPDKKKYEGEGITFKAKFIGVTSVSDARGDKMSQDAMQKLKLNVKNTGPHKRKINISVSLQGIKIKCEKTGAVLYHHPVSLISFISQDITDARAFGYVFGSTSEPHQFIAIKTEKPAFHVVLAIRDLFQTVLFRKQEEIENAKLEVPFASAREIKNKASMVASNEQDKETAKNENIYFEVLLTEPVLEETPAVEEIETTVDDLIGLQSELNQLQEGIEQMDTSIATATAFNSEVPVLENDPFDTSFVLGPKRDSFAVPMPTPIAAPVPTSDIVLSDITANGDKYAVFSSIDSSPSIFEKPGSGDQAAADMKQLEEEIARKTAPPKPPRIGSTDPSIFADLDPLGKDRPYKDKTEFFQDVKNPPKKVLNDLVDPNKESSKVQAVNLLIPPVPFSVETAPSVHNVSSSSLPNSFRSNLKLSLADGTGDMSPDSNFIKVRNGSDPSHSAVLLNVQQYATVTPKHQGKSLSNMNHSIASTNQTTSASSSPIPIPPRNSNLEKNASFSNGSMGSPYSKSPLPNDSPNYTDYFIQNYNSEGSSPNGCVNGFQQTHYMNGENGNVILANVLYSTKHNNINGLINATANASNQSRPRPRPSLNKGGFVQNGGRTVSSHSLSSDSSSDYEMISRENMQSITNVLLTNDPRLRAQSLNIDANNDFKLQAPSEKNIFAKKNDPFADDFFFSLPKKNGLLTNAEIKEYV